MTMQNFVTEIKFTFNVITIYKAIAVVTIRK